MEAIYWVLNWACHRRCTHCYDDRFRPYVRGALANVVAESQLAYPKIIENLPDDFTFLTKSGRRERGRLVLAGGELLIDGVREPVFYPVLEALRAKYGAHGPRIGIQTTGDILTPKLIGEMLDRGVDMIAIASIDDYHVGLQGDAKFALMEKIRAMMAPFGVKEVPPSGQLDPRLNPSAPIERPGRDVPTFLFFGAQPDLWIGELWPRGRAWKNGLSNATYETNFCARWSGGQNFLNHGHAGSEVAVEPDGAIYPCCLKTKAPLGYLTEEKLIDILDSLKSHPALQAINAGDPEAMGLENGWSRDDYRRASETTDPKGKPFANPCIGCDAYFEQKLGPELRALRLERLARRGLASSS